jgi:hypothetical protein
MDNNQQRNLNNFVSKSGSTIYRVSWRGDRWGCKSCSKIYDKWGMIDHRCNKNGRKYTEPPSGAAGRHTAYSAVDDKFCITKQQEVITTYMTTELSTEARAVIQKNIEARQQSSKFIKLLPGEKKVLQFVPEKTEQVQAEFNGEKSLRFRYSVVEDGSNQEKCFEVSKMVSENIDTLLLEGHTKLKIQRSGIGRETRYLTIPA